MLNSNGTEVCINLNNTYNNRKFFSFSWLCRKLSYTYPLCLSLTILRSFVFTLSHIFLSSVSKQPFEFPMRIFSLRKHSISTHFSGGCSKSNKFSRVWYECVCANWVIQSLPVCQSKSIHFRILTLYGLFSHPFFLLHHFFLFKQWRRWVSHYLHSVSATETINQCFEAFKVSYRMQIASINWKSKFKLLHLH